MKRLIASTVTALAMAVCADTPTILWSEIGVVEMAGGVTRVTVTNDVARTVRFTDDLGEVGLNLNGHSIVGPAASAGIQIVHGSGTGTHLKIVDSWQTGTAMVKGGDAVTSGGNGGAGVDVSTDAVNVLISIGETVTVKGGAGRWGGSYYYGGNGGSGGIGINGNVSVFWWFWW